MEERQTSRLGWVLVAIGLLVLGAGAVMVVGTDAVAARFHTAVSWVNGGWRPATATRGCGTGVQFVDRDHGQRGYLSTFWSPDWTGQAPVPGEARVIDDHGDLVEFRSGDVTFEAARNLIVDCP